MRIYTLFSIAILFFLQPSIAFAQKPCKEISNTGKTNIIVFVNGIINEDKKACASLGVLRNRIEEHSNEFDFDLKYNPTNGLYDDKKELLVEAQISDQAWGLVQTGRVIREGRIFNSYEYALGRQYALKIKSGKYINQIEKQVYGSVDDLYHYLKSKVVSGKHVIVVAHSQGNYLIEGAIALMVYRDEQDIQNRIKVIGIAPTSSTTQNNMYISLSSDQAIALHRIQVKGFQYFKPLAPNQQACVADVSGTHCDSNKTLTGLDMTVHGFSEIYLNPQIINIQGVPLIDILKGYVDQSTKVLDSLPAYTEIQKQVIQTGDKKASFKIVAAYNMFDSFTVHFEAQSEDKFDIVSYAWDFGDGVETMRDMAFLNHTYRAIGAFKTTLTVTTKSGKQYSCSKVYIFEKPFDSTNTYLLAQACR